MKLSRGTRAKNTKDAIRIKEETQNETCNTLPVEIKLENSDETIVKAESIEIEELHTKYDKEVTHSIFRCPDCLKVFNRKWNYEQHCAVHYPMLQKYKCAKCGRSFAYRTTYSSHLASHDDTLAKFPCPTCSKVTTLMIYTCAQFNK